MTFTSQLGGDPSRVIVQLLEGGAASGATSPDAAVARLRAAAERLPLTDVCLGWGLPLPLVEAVATEAARQAARLWLWHPLLSGDGRYLPDTDRVLGSDGIPVEAPGGMAEFAFDCPIRGRAMEAALDRLAEAAGRHPWSGVFLDKIRWPSPTRDPAAELGCFCEACHLAAADQGLDLAAVARRLAAAEKSPRGRLGLLRALLQDGTDERLDGFLAWRSQAITAIVAAAAGRLTQRPGPDGSPMRLALDVFSPALSRMVGQDIASLAPLGEFTKAMLYLGTHGPAGLSFELCRLAGWLASGGVPAPVERLSELLGLPLPAREPLCSSSLHGGVFAAQLAELQRLAGPGAAAGIDAVAIDGLAVLPDDALGEAVEVARRSGVPIVLSWDLMAIPDDRLTLIGGRLSEAA